MRQLREEIFISYCDEDPDACGDGQAQDVSCNWKGGDI